MSETEVAAAVAQQEEYIKRIRCCFGTPGLRHAWKSFPAIGGGSYEACTRCLVGRTNRDHERRVQRVPVAS